MFKKTNLLGRDFFNVPFSTKLFVLFRGWLLLPVTIEDDWCFFMLFLSLSMATIGQPDTLR